MEYFILKPDGEQTGTYSLDQIRSMLNSGYIGLDTRYWHEGISDWQPLDRIEESVNFPEPSPNEPPSCPAAPLAALVRQPRPRHHPRRISSRSAPAPPPSAAPPSSHPSSRTSPRRSRPPTSPPPRSSSNTPTPTARLPPSSRFRSREPPPSAARPAAPLLTGAQLRTLSTFLLALAIIAAVIASRHPARSPLSKVTLTSRNDYVLVDQAAIKTFEADMKNSPVADSLQKQAALTTDPVVLQKINIGLQQETARHTQEILQQYLRGGKAQVVAPGTYNTVAYLNDDGVLVPAQPGQPWVRDPLPGQHRLRLPRLRLHPDLAVTPAASPARQRKMRSASLFFSRPESAA